MSSRKNAVTRRKGGQPGNQNSVTTGLYRDFSKLDRRTSASKAIEHAEYALINALGDPSVQERLLCRRAAVTLYRLAIVDSMDPQDLDTVELQLRLNRDLRDTFRIIGVSDRQPVEQSLKDYLASRGGTADGGDD